MKTEELHAIEQVVISNALNLYIQTHCDEMSDKVLEDTLALSELILNASCVKVITGGEYDV